MLRGWLDPCSNVSWEVPGEYDSGVITEYSSSRRDTRYYFIYRRLSTVTLREVPLGLYIYLGCLCGSGRSGYELSKLNKYNTLHRLYYNLVNTYTKYLIVFIFG